MVVNSRESLKEYCLRELGAPVIQINVDDTQLEDRLDEALEYFRQYHSDGLERIYLKHEITATDVTNKWVPVSDLVYGITRIIPLNSGTSSRNIFDLQYQLRLNDLYDLSSTSMIYYTTAMQHISLLDHILNGHQLIRFNRYKNMLELDAKWGSSIIEGQFIVIEALRAMDPETYVRMYSDPWLKKYTTALFKRQWGANVSKFSGMLLPGGIKIDGVTMYETAISEIKECEEELLRKSPPLQFFVG